VAYSTKNLSIQDKAVHMKEEKKGLILFFIFLEEKRERGSYGGRGSIRAHLSKSSTASRITSGTLSRGGRAASSGEASRARIRFSAGFKVLVVAR
jgi:hypothetical protein